MIMKKLLPYLIFFYLISIFIEINSDVDEINYLNVFYVSFALADLEKNAEKLDEGFKIPDYNVEELKNESNKKYFITGFINQKIAYGFFKSDPKLTMVRTIFHPEAKYEFENEWFLVGSGNAYYDLAYTIEGRDQFNDETLENNEYEIELRELFLNAKINYFLNVKVGRQIVAWGESNFAQITDVVNPRDKTQLGLVDLEDARIPVTSVRISYLKNPWIFDIVSIHEIRGNKIGGYGSDFDYFKNFRGSDIIVNDEEWNESEFCNSEMVLKVSRTFNASDLTLVLGSFYEDAPYLDINAYENDDGQFEYKIEPMHNRISAIALSANRAFGETLIKAEFGAFFNKTFNSNNYVNQENNDDINQLQNLSQKKKPC